MEQLSVTIQTDYIKLDSLLKFAGLCDTGRVPAFGLRLMKS